MACEKGASFEECELAILRMAVDRIDKREGEKMLKNPEVKKIIHIVQNLVCKFIFWNNVTHFCS